MYPTRLDAWKMYRDDNNRSLPPPRGFELARRRAEAGDYVAMLAMHMVYRWGVDGFSRDLETSDEWLRRSNARCLELAEAGDPDAMSTWASLLLAGVWKVPQDEAAGVRWFFRAAEAGDGDALRKCAGFLLYGKHGVSVDDAAAVALCRRAVGPDVEASKDGLSMRRLACCHHFGVGTEQDEEEAFRWLARSARAWNDDDTLYAVGGEYERRGDDANALRFYRFAADCGHAAALKVAALWLYSGRGARRDLKAARAYALELANEEGDDDGAKLYYVIRDEQKHGPVERRLRGIPLDPPPPLHYVWL